MSAQVLALSRPPARPAPTAALPVPPEERPRDRLLRRGAESLTDAELLSLLFRGGRRPVAVDLARRVLAAAGGLAGLAAAGPVRLRWLRPPQRAAVLAAAELACRMARAEVPDRDPLDSPGRVAAYLRLRYSRPDQEIAGALYLDVRHRLLGEAEIARGDLHSASVFLRPVLVEALLHGAAAVVLFHTHPSGDPTPSSGDLTFTQRLRTAGELLGVTVQDHLILGARGRWESLRRLGTW